MLLINCLMSFLLLLSFLLPTVLIPSVSWPKNIYAVDLWHWTHKFTFPFGVFLFPKWMFVNISAWCLHFNWDKIPTGTQNLNSEVQSSFKFLNLLYFHIFNRENLLKTQSTLRFGNGIYIKRYIVCLPQLNMLVTGMTPCIHS